MELEKLPGGIPPMVPRGDSKWKKRKRRKNDIYPLNANRSRVFLSLIDADSRRFREGRSLLRPVDTYVRTQDACNSLRRSYSRVSHPQTQTHSRCTHVRHTHTKIHTYDIHTHTHVSQYTSYFEWYIKTTVTRSELFVFSNVYIFRRSSKFFVINAY